MFVVRPEKVGKEAELELGLWRWVDLGFAEIVGQGPVCGGVQSSGLPDRTSVEEW